MISYSIWLSAHCCLSRAAAGFDVPDVPEPSLLMILLDDILQ